MKIYRLYTENKNRKFIEQICNEELKGFTIYEGVGFWQGAKEKSLIIEVVSSSHATPVKLTRIAKAICGFNQQDTVIGTVQEISAQLYGVSGFLYEL